MSKKQQRNDEDLLDIVRKPMNEQKVYWGVHYRKVKDEWVAERVGSNCLRTMKKLVSNWKSALDSDGFFMGEITGNTYPQLKSYEEMKELYA